MTLEEIIELRKKLPKNWHWQKCYEMSYISAYSGREFIKKHWALKDTDDAESKVCSLGLISHDRLSNKTEFFENDAPVLFVQQSLDIVDFLLSEIGRLNKNV